MTRKEPYLSEKRWRALWAKILVAALLIGILQPITGQAHEASAASGDSPNHILISMGAPNNGQLGRTTETATIQPPGIVTALEGKAIKDVSAGDGISLALTEEGEVYTFGKLNPIGEQERPLKLENLPAATAISAGSTHALIATVTGSVYAIGDNTYGQLGLSDNQNRTVPVQIPGLENVAAISAGGGERSGGFSLVLIESGEVYAFGSNLFGKLGLGKTVDRILQPERVSITDRNNADVSNQVKAISAGENHALLLLKDGRVFSFGGNDYTQLGIGEGSYNYNSPQQIKNPSGGVVGSWSGWATAIDAGNSFSYVLKDNGTLYAFGRNFNGQLGDGTTSSRNAPVAVTSIPEPIASFSAGDSFGLFVTPSGKLYGTGNLSALGISNNAFVTSLTAISQFMQVEQVDAGSGYALLTAGILNSTISPVTAAFNIFPAKQQDIEVELMLNGNEFTGIYLDEAELDEGTDYTLIGSSVTLHKSYLSSFEAGEVELEFRFNEGISQMLTINILNEPESFILTTNAVFDKNPDRQQPVRIELQLNGNSLSSIDFKTAYSTSRLTENTDYLLEDNVVVITNSVFHYQGTGSYSLLFTFSAGEPKSVPLQIKWTDDSFLTPSDALFETDPRVAKDIKIEVLLNGNQLLDIKNEEYVLQEGTDYTTEAVDDNRLRVTLLKSYLLAAASGSTELSFRFDGGKDRQFHVTYASQSYGQNGVYAFGSGYNFQLGLMDNDSRLLPTYVDTMEDKRIRSVDAGDFFSIILTEEGEVYVFSNIMSYFSDEQATSIRLSDLPPITAISAGQYHALMLSNNGEVYGWGLNFAGQLGSEPTGAEDEDFMAAPQKIEGLSGIQAIAAGGMHSLALTKDGKVYALGGNYFGQLGISDWDVNYSANPVLLDGIPAIQAIAAGAGHSLLLTADGRVLSFGAGEYGQLGLGDWDDRAEPAFIANVSDIIAIDAGGDYYLDEEEGDWTVGHSLLLTSEGSVLSFGYGEDGQLGNDDEANQNVPTLIGAGLPPIKAVATGAYHTLLLSADNEVYVFGYNYNGQLGLGHEDTVWLPTKNDRLSGAAGIAAGSFHSLAWFKQAANSSISPVSAAFDRNPSKQKPIVIDMTLNGHALVGISDGSALTAGADYTVEGTKVILAAAYLAKLAIGQYELILYFSGGQPQKLTIIVADSTDSGGSTPGGGGGGSTAPTDEEEGNSNTESGNGTNNGGISSFLAGNASMKELLSKLQNASSEETIISFTDTANHWAKVPISWFAGHGLVTGYTDGSFKPNQSITRAEFVTMLSRLFTMNPTAANASFTDIQGSWASESILAFASAGIVNGYSDSTFRPNQPITREEIVAILGRLLQLSELQAGGNTSFTDLNQAAQYAREAIALAAGAGIIQGSGNNSFNPKGNATRAEVIQVLFNTLKLFPEFSAYLK